MGSPLGPVLANAFLSHHEVNWLDECPLSFAPMFYARYISTMFLFFYKQETMLLNYDYFSSKHPNIRFIYEVKRIIVFPFLTWTSTAKMIDFRQRFTEKILSPASSPTLSRFFRMYTRKDLFPPYSIEPI